MPDIGFTIITTSLRDSADIDNTSSSWISHPRLCRIDALVTRAEFATVCELLRISKLVQAPILLLLRDTNRTIVSCG